LDSKVAKIKEIWRNLEKDPIFKLLVRNASLTKRQAEALFYDITAEEYGLKLSYEERARLSGVSKGAYARTRQQGIQNITKALFTVILASYMGILQLPSMNWIMQVGELLKEGDAESLHKALNMLREGRMRHGVS